MNILLTSVGRRSYIVKYFKDALYGIGEVHVANSSDINPCFSIADKSIVTPLIYSSEYIPFIKEYCIKNSINAIISLFDVDLPILASNIEVFNQIGVKVIISDKNTIDICNDKWKTYEFFSRNNINFPKTYLCKEDLKKAIKNYETSYPIILKPRWGMGTIATYQVNNDLELEVIYNKVLFDVKNTYLKYESYSDIDNCIIFQEKIFGKEYGLDVINDLNGNYQITVVKEKIEMRAGETYCSKTIKHEPLSLLGEKISKLLNHVGNLDVDLIHYNDIPYILDLNARFGGGYPFSHIAGIDLPKAIVKWLNHQKTYDYEFKYDCNVLSYKEFNIRKIN